MLSVFKRTVSGKPSNFTLFITLSSPSVDFVLGSLIARVSLDPSFLRTERRRKSAATILRAELAIRLLILSAPLRSLLFSLSCQPLLRNLLVEDAQARDDCFAAKTTGCASKGGRRWSSLPSSSSLAAISTRTFSSSSFSYLSNRQKTTQLCFSAELLILQIIVWDTLLEDNFPFFRRRQWFLQISVSSFSPEVK